MSPSLAIIITVNQTGDQGDGSNGTSICDIDNNIFNGIQCTLRAAIQTANATAGTDTIVFSIGTGIKTIAPASQLPSITEAVIIDGFTQKIVIRTREVDCHVQLDHPCIEINGAGAGAASGLNVFASGCTVRGLVINGFSGSGMAVGGSNNTIGPNYIGTNITGDAPISNLGSGITVSGNNNLIGGAPVAGIRQVISGNGTDFPEGGISISGQSSTGNRIEGNLIGTDDTGTVAFNNLWNETGVMVVGGTNTTIGGTTAAARNIISGNFGDGIYVNIAGSVGIVGNFIGLDIGGTIALANKDNGVNLVYQPGMVAVVGGATPESRNVISGNFGSGVRVTGIPSYPLGEVIVGNYIGTDVSSRFARGNFFAGVRLDVGTTRCVVRGNVIAGNGYGVAIFGPPVAPYLTSQNRVVANYIGTNALSDAIGNFGDGVWINASTNNLIGGTVLDRNYIASHGQNGILITGPEATGTVIQWNLIGYGPDAATHLGNGGSGVAILDSSGHTVGGGGPMVGNVISGNLKYGVLIRNTGMGASNNVVYGNYIGTDPTGSLARGNTLGGVQIESASGNTIGSSGLGTGNLISGNGGAGVRVLRENFLPVDNGIFGNGIGIDRTGRLDLGNAEFGVHLEGAERTDVGGPVEDERNIISGNNLGGIFITNPAPTGPEQTRVLGNYIGTDVSGMAAIPNSGSGVLIFDASGQRIGGIHPGEGNVISGNNGAGICIADAAASADSNGVFGNFIGTDATGTARLGNFTFGVDISHGFYNSIGLAEVGGGNVVSANGISGILLHDGASRNILSNNFIGTDVTGLVDLGNNVDGVIVENAPENYIGADFFGSSVVGNVIAGNDRHGVHLLDADAFDNVIERNWIGVGVDETTAIPNLGSGVFVDRAPDNVVGSADDPPQGNIIAHNGEDGVTVKETAGTAILRNSMSANGGLGIDLDDDGVSPNDIPDDDLGANELRNFPRILAVVNGEVTHVTGVLESVADTAFRIDFFSNANCDPSAHGEGEQYLGGLNALTGADGTVSFHIALPVRVDLGRQMTAASTDPARNTSEFSVCAEVVPSSPADFDFDGDVDGDNYSSLFDCLTGPLHGPPSKSCEPADFDHDDDVDLDDAALFFLKFTGAP